MGTAYLIPKLLKLPRAACSLRACSCLQTLRSACNLKRPTTNTRRHALLVRSVQLVDSERCHQVARLRLEAPSARFHDGHAVRIVCRQFAAGCWPWLPGATLTEQRTPQESSRKFASTVKNRYLVTILLWTFLNRSPCCNTLQHSGLSTL